MQTKQKSLWFCAVSIHSSDKNQWDCVKTSLTILPISIYFSAGNAQHLLDISFNFKDSPSNSSKVTGFSKQSLVSDRPAHSFSSMKSCNNVSVRQHLTSFYLKQSLWQVFPYSISKIEIAISTERVHRSANSSTSKQ